MHTPTQARRAFLQGGWVIANHILVSFHVAFISSILVLPAAGAAKGEILELIFWSPETLVSALFMLLSFQAGIATHELGHFLAAARLNALSEAILEPVQRRLRAPWPWRLWFLAGLFALAPWGRARGIKRDGLSYYPLAPYNLAVAAAGPRASRNLAWLALPPAILLISAGLLWPSSLAIYAGRLFLGIGVVALLDFLLADPGKLREFTERERAAKESARSVNTSSGWFAEAAGAKRRLVESHMGQVTHPRLGPITAPWQFRNCGMGGRHTEKEYPESNISMQEAMFLILGASNYAEAQEMTVRLQNRLKEIIEKEEGCRVMGIGLEGGLAPYVERGSYPLPEVRLWAMMKQAIEECGYRPGLDVALALDPAMNELETAYREEFGLEDCVGTYLFWRDKAKTVLDRDAVLELYRQAMTEYELPILSIEDGFSEHDFEGWHQLVATLGDRVLVIGDDLVTTNDRTIEQAAEKGLINSVLIKANQIGTLEETLLALLVSKAKNLEVVVSHRSKSPNDDMEAHIALAANALGLKAGGGANTERLIKYQAVARLLDRVGQADGRHFDAQRAMVERIHAHEEPTNAGIPTVGVEVDLALPQAGVHMEFAGATPLGTSAGTGEAVHLVDAAIEKAEHREVLSAHASLFEELEPGVCVFKKTVTEARVRATEDEALLGLFSRARRYGGKGCLNAVDNVHDLIAPQFEGRNVTTSTLQATDRALLELELRVARRRGKLGPQASPESAIAIMQRKQNLGMNAVLSVSLALARAIAHLHGKQLHELLREEMLKVIERLARTFGVEIQGSSFPDYVVALRKVDAILQAQGEPMYLHLRRAAGIYQAGEDRLEPSPTREPRGVVALSHNGSCEVPAATSGDAANPFVGSEQRQIAALDLALYGAQVGGGQKSSRTEALHRYLEIKALVEGRVRPFEILNHRIFLDGDLLIVPYLVGETLVIHGVCDGVSETLASRRFAPGTIFTDRLVLAASGVHGEVVDLESEVFGFDPEQAQSIRIERIRDMSSLLERLNTSANYKEVVYYLRFLVARLCSLSFKGFLGAKNLQPEVSILRSQLARLLNGPFAARLRLPMRVLVRNISGLVLRPNLIDEIWNDTISLAEIHVRGSSITNELRRSSHHALGRRTLELARAYLEFLESGHKESLEAIGCDEVSAADEQARTLRAPRGIVARVVANLDELLGTSQIVTRIREWQVAWTDELLRCEFGNSLQTELAALIDKGITSGNRWGYLHHLRILKKKAKDVAHFDPCGIEAGRRLEALQAACPGDAGFDVAGAERQARECVKDLVASLRQGYERELFESLAAVIASYERGAFLETFAMLHVVRGDVEKANERGGFAEMRYLLCQLDCLLEEMGYLALRHLASAFDERGVQLRPCLEIIKKAAWNLGHDGVFSRELCDLADMANDPSRTHAELLNVLLDIQRNYQKMFQRASVAYEMMGRRLELTPEELRAVLANFQRYMHDLNSIVQFADLAKTHVRDQVEDLSRPIGGTRGGPVDPFDVLHLSHRQDIACRVEDRTAAINLRELYGSKASGLAYISYLGIPTRDGFVLPTSVPRAGLHEREPERLKREIAAHLEILEEDIARHEGVPLRFGDPANPLLLAVRGGSVFSMPGILSTVVFVGINDRIVETLSRDDAWYAYDSYRRFLASYAEAAWDLNLEEFDLVEDAKRRYGVEYKHDLPFEAMKEVTEASKAILRKHGHGEELDALLEDPRKQLFGAVQAVFASWNTDLAVRYREIKGLCHGWHTAVVVQQMSSGNRRNEHVEEDMDETETSLTGVIPHTVVTELGARVLCGDIKFSAAGDDLVGGLTAAGSLEPISRLRTLTPMLERNLQHITAKLRRFRGTDPEVEFTVDRGVLSVLQARMAEAADDREATAFAEPGEAVAHGIGIRGGAFRGLVAFDQADLTRLAALDLSGRDDVDGVLLVLENPTPDEIPMILACDGLLTARGGSTSHAAVAIHAVEEKRYRAVLSAVGLRVKARQHQAVIQDAAGQVLGRFRAGDIVSIHGQTGDVYLGSRAVLGADSTAEREPAPAPREPGRSAVR